MYQPSDRRQRFSSATKTLRRAVMTGVFASGALATRLAAQSASAAATRYDEADQGLTVHVEDLGPKFLNFWSAARDETDPEKRFATWKRLYDFAAVPPGPEGDAISRRLLDSAWNKYPSALTVISAGARGMHPDPLAVLKSVAAILQPIEPVTVNVVAYVGGFEGNAYSYRGQNGLPVVCVPLEMSADARVVVFAHEMTHAVHMQIAKLSGGWERSIAATLMQEGLAVEVSRAAVPGRDVRAYIEASPGWFDAARAHESAILNGILPYLSRKDGETVFKFTMGQGTTGTEREAYYVGWVVMEHLRAKGMTLAQIARVGEADMPRVAEEAIREVLAKQH